MHHPSPAAAVDAAADPTVPGRSLTFERRWAASSSEQLERTRLIEQARLTDATSQLKRCCPSAARVLESLSWRALTRLAANQPVDPNDPNSWRSPDAHAQIVLRRHGITGLDSTGSVVRPGSCLRRSSPPSSPSCQPRNAGNAASTRGS